MSMLNGGAAPIPGPPYGTVRDATTFYSALVPKQKTAVLPKVSVPLVDTVIVVKGKPIRWLHSTASGEATEKLHVDKESIHATFRTAALSTPNNLAKLVSIVRRDTGRFDVYNVEDTADFMKSLGTSAAINVVSVQRYVHARGGDRAIFRNVYSNPPNTRSPVTMTTRYPEMLTPEGGGGTHASRSEFAPVRSFQETLNEMLDEYTRRVVVQLEGALKCRVTHLALDYIIDEKESAHLLWPTEFRSVEVKRDGTVVLTEPLPQPVAPAPKPAPAPAPAIDPEAEWAAAKARAFEEQQRMEAAIQQEFASLIDRTVGEGTRGHIIIVDADPFAVVTAVRALVPEGYAVTVAADGPKALALTRSITFDCMLLARDLPSLSGLEVAKILRQREASLMASRPAAHGAAAYHLPLVAFTANTDPEDLKLYMEVGMDGCVSKPVDISALLSTMSAAVPQPSGAPLRRADSMAATVPSSAFGGRPSTSAGSMDSMGTGGLPAISPLATPASTAASRSRASFTGGGAAAAVMSSRAAVNGVAASNGGAGINYGMMSASAPTSPAKEIHPFGETEEQPMRQTGAVGLKGARQMAQARKGTSQRRARSKSPSRAESAAMDASGDSQDGPLHVSMPSGAAIPGVPPPVIGPGSLGGATLPVPEDEDGSRMGIFQLDAETAMPYCVMGKRRPGIPLFHMVIVGDIFDTYESYQILFRKIVTKLPGLRVLLFNYPGQAYTEWRRDVVLNNEYLAGTLQALMTYLGPGGTKEFDLDGGTAPFHMVGVGNGGAIANYFAAAYHGSHPSMRSLVLINGFAHVDAHYAGVMHDAMNVFACSPASRPDLPVYFFARFLFSPSYLQKVGAPLALNLYTAVSNPITLQGRIALCQGALSHVDCRRALEGLSLPMILVASSKDGLVKPSHVAVMVEARGGEVRSIKRALAERARAVVIWLRAGHEVFQEARKPMVNLFEQLATGYHERNDVSFLPLVPEDAMTAGDKSKSQMIADEARQRAASMAAQTSSLQAMSMAAAAAAQGQDPLKPVPGARAPNQVFEDHFLDNVVTTMRNTTVKSKFPVNPADGGATYAPPSRSGPIIVGRGELNEPQEQYTDIPDALEVEPEIPMEVLQHASPAATQRKPGATKLGKALSEEERRALAQTESKQLNRKLLLDPELAAFERRDKEFSQAAEKKQITTYAAPEVKEYMSWRIRRNKKRLQRIEACAVTIQRAWRAYLARTLVARMRQQRAALDMQRWWRGCLGRKLARQRKKEQWAVRVVQRYWRGFSGRSVTWRMKEERRAACLIQKNWRGSRARKFIRMLRDLRKNAAVKIQAAYRRFRAQREAWKKRDQRNAAVNIQRVWRGHLGRARAAKERDRYLFSKSQAQGIEFGRQMLMEHKLHGTKLQSEVSLLTKEKLGTEEKIEGVLAEIATFEQGVRALEKEMVELSRAEAEAAGTLDDEAKLELRENKIRLDREFAAMLVKIADRRETLSALEAKLQTIDRARTAKREELKDLERKLVVLLEQQQQELQSIRMRQERRSEAMVEDAVSAVTAALTGKDGGGVGEKYIAGGSKALAIKDGSNTLAASLGGNTGAMVVAGPGGQMIPAQGGGGDGGGAGGPTPQQRAEAQALMSSTETMMKFGFMSMSLTYFSSLNMIRAMRQLGTANTMLASNPMLALIGQMGAAASGGGNPAAIALNATGGLGSMPGMGGTMPPMLGMGGTGGPFPALTAGPGMGGTIMAPTAASSATLASSIGATGANYTPALRAGRLPGQEAPELSLWTVGDVSSWLDSLALGQYKDAFADAAVDGAFLSELTDEDLRNTLGIEHALHRKKILSAILKLRVADEERKAKALLGDDGSAGDAAPAAPSMGMAGGASTRMASTERSATAAAAVAAAVPGAVKALGAAVAGASTGTRPGGFASGSQLQLEAAEAAAAARAANRDAGLLKLDELMSWVRHNKGKLLSDALAAIPDGKFDPSTLKAQYIPGYGTQYIDMLNGPAFHINKTDDKGNNLLLAASQNGRIKLAQLLVRKGANPNHQNALGNTAMHYAMAYQFHELAAWLVDPEKGGASDELLNSAGLGPYDGLAAGE